MKAKTIQDLRDDVEEVLRRELATTPAGAETVSGRPRSPAMSKLSVVISPLNTLAVTAVSPIFHGRTFDERTDWLWNILEEVLTEEEQERVDFWLLLSPREARAVRPATVRPRRRPARITPSAPRA
jgi:hypothetical protein